MKKEFSIEFDKVRDYVLTLFDEDHSKINYAVSVEQQQKEIELLKKSMQNDSRFYFIVDLLTFEIKEPPFNLSKWLYWSEQDFSLRFYINNVIHPARKMALLLMAEQLYTHLCKGSYQLKFMVQRFSSLVPLLHRDGHYVIAKKTSSVFQFDTKNRLLSYLNEFTITDLHFDIDQLNAQSLTPNLYNSYGQTEKAVQQEIMSKVIERFLDLRIFTTKQLQIARILAYEGDITKEQIAEILDQHVDGVDWHYRQFLKNARTYFKIPFATGLDAARYIRKEGLL